MVLPINPWLMLANRSPFVLHEDLAAVDSFNDRARNNTRVETTLLPEPFVGRVGAPIVLLALNPGVNDRDFALHSVSAFQSRVRACHRQVDTRWPYYYLDPKVNGSGAEWSARVLRPLIRAVGLERVARGVVLFEFMPYHSRKFAHARLELPSQQFTIAQVKSVLPTVAAIFVTRGQSLWSQAIPELANHPRRFYTRSVQNITISPRNCPDGWEAALDGLRNMPIA